MLVYLLSRLQLDRLLVEHVEEEHLVWMVSDQFFRQKSSSLASLTELRGLVLSYNTTTSLSIFMKRSESAFTTSNG